MIGDLPSAGSFDRRSLLTGLAGLALCGGALSIPRESQAAGGGLAGVITANQVTVVNFWASWCSGCVNEMPALNSVYRQMQGRGIGMVGVNNKQDAATVSAFVRRRGIAYPVVLDLDGSTLRAYGVTELPATFLVDQRGRVRRSFTGETTASVLRAKIEAVLREA